MTTTSQVPAITDYLVATAKAWPALAGVIVADGPQLPVATQSRERVLWFGCNPAALQDPSADAVQAWPVLDYARTKDEDATIQCAAQHWSGDTSNKVHRDGAAAIVAGVELMLRGNPAQGGPGDASMGGLALWSGVDALTWHQRQVSNGALCLVTFGIVYKARLVTS